MTPDDASIAPWRVVALVPALAPDEAHVWRTDLERSLGAHDGAAVLDADERARAARFCFEHDRRHWTRARARLRCLVGAYLGRAPAEVTFACGAHGKPELAGPRPEALQFNVSHSAGRALLAFARTARIGVDLERIRPELARDGIAAAAFSAGERAELARLPAAEREAAFFACWSRKEAFVKATGEGIGYGLEAFDVSLAPGAAARLVATRRPGDDARSWTMRALAPFPGFAAALVHERACRAIRCFDLDAAGALPGGPTEEPWTKTTTTASATGSC